MSIRRNFIHNCFVHPVCGLIWLVADLGGVVGLRELKLKLVDFGERFHQGKAIDG